MDRFADSFRPAVHNLGDGCEFLAEQAPDELLWDEGLFAAGWLLHPPDKHKIMIHGRLVETPRWQQAYGTDYHYTGQTNRALPVPPLLQPLSAWARIAIEPRLNGLLLNWYEGPDHYIGPHHDSIKHMVRNAPIVTVSFGETRTFRLTKEKRGEAKQVRDFEATHGTVFVMPFQTNVVWKHSVPKSTRYTGRRISVTFRAFDTGVLPDMDMP